MYFSVEMILFVLARWLLLCVLSLLAVIFGWRKLARGDRNGWVLLAASLLMLGYYGAQWVQSLLTPANRIAEVAAWPRVKVAEADRPRVLIVRGYGDTLPPFVYFLAETGLFDVYAVNGLDFQPKKIWRMDVGLRDNCAKDRSERDEMIVLTGWGSCATATPAESAPRDGLILYTMSTLAPHSWATTRKDYNNQAVWTYELALRAGDVEQLVAYDEYVAFPEMRFNWFAGPYLVPEGPPRRTAAVDSDIAAPEPGAFVLSALGIDERTVAPPSALSIEGQRALTENLSLSNQPDDTQRALDLIAAAPRDPAFRNAMRRLASNPATSTNMLVRHGPRWCKKVNRLLRYRDALMEGCANSAIPADTCGQLGYATQWLRFCADHAEPVWRSEDKPARRVFIADVGGGQNTKVLLTRPARATEIRVPADRGALDIVLRNRDPRVFVFTGAAVCIERLTVLENGQTGVAGVDPGRVRFAAPTGTGSWINPKAPYSGDFVSLLGFKPDDIINGHEGDIDLADALAKSGPAIPCTGASDAGLKSGGTLRLDTGAILTAPPLLPFVRKEASRALTVPADPPRVYLS
ncbi:hypothetical protein JQ620_26485 [Bradyrhizobium sp. AUGA SZCCT0274]|uniref:hypothetical protein n=1 Tax=Bradyrhizobium sp. AUGA SZCCT0274 TaxID=2807670 RepID=UPI001BABE6F6|nr:hypothetical protein [Bradyrhizobium sp. AUGA SZCCT0274]MBR1243643.1 hypothetical protein [Bradyrhizobium sp. AUGA SZCCT0274]